MKFRTHTPFPLRSIHAPRLTGMEKAEGGSDRKLETLPKAPGGTSPLAQTIKSLCVSLASAPTQKASGFSQMPSHSLTLSFLFFFSRIKANRMIHSLIKSTHKKKGGHPRSQTSVEHKLLHGSPPYTLHRKASK